LFSGTLPENVRVNFSLAPRLGRVLVDKSQLEQVLLNLVLNARDAMPKGGKIKIVSANVALRKDEARALSDISPGRFVVVSVSDTGSGIDAETRKHLFEPFYMTKKPRTSTGTGTGMGLAMAYGLIKQNGGDLCAKSAPGQGTTFQIYLPRFTGTHKAERRPASKPHPAEGGAETILVTEDEDIVRTISVRALEKRGYRVIQAHDAREALKLSKSHPGPIDLLLTDVVMPGMNGQELVAALKLTRPDARILYMSGYSREMVARHGVMESGAGFIEKAFSAEKLCRTVRAILDQPGTTSKRKTSHSGG
jgi:two-component system, cell cycle sensor histidine kinase and response regulator CckA